LHPLSQFIFVFASSIITFESIPYFFGTVMEQNDCKNARLRRKLVIQQMFNARSNQDSCKCLTSYLKHLSSQILHQKFIYKSCISIFVCFFMLQMTKKRMQERKLNLQTILLKVTKFQDLFL